MKPLKDRKSKRAADSAARSYLRAKLGWLRGFPLERAGDGCLVWMTLPPLGSRAGAGRLRVDRELIRRTEFGRNAALRRFPNALPRLVGDVGSWKQQTDNQLEILKAAVHDQTPMPGLSDLLLVAGIRHSLTDQALQIAARSPDLNRLCIAASWVHWGNDTDLRDALGQIEQHKGDLSVLLDRLGHPAGLCSALQCLQLLSDGCTPAFLHRLADAKCWEVPLSHGDFAGRMRAELSNPSHGKEGWTELLAEGFDRPPPRLGPALVDFVHGLSSLPRKPRLRQLELLSVLVPDALLEVWDDWWKRAGELEREVKGLISQHAPGRGAKARCSALGERIKEELGSPHVFHWDDVYQTIERVSKDTAPTAYLALLDALTSVPGCHRQKPLAQFLVENWNRELRRPRHGWSVIARLLSAQGKLLRRTAHLGGTAKLWICETLTDDLISTWIYEATPRSRIEATLDVVGALLNDAPACHEHWGPFGGYTGWETLVEATSHTTDTALIARLLEVAPPRAGGLHGADWGVLLKLSGCDPEVFQALAQSWKPRAWSAFLTAELSRLAGDTEAAQVMVAALTNGDARRLRHLLAHNVLADLLGETPLDAPPAGQGATLDISPYPASLHGLLHELAKWDPDPERAADQILAKDYPRLADIEAELAFLRSNRAGAADAGVAARIKSLERRRHGPPQVSPQRLENHRTKLQRRLDHARLTAWEEELSTRVRAGLQRKIGATPDDEWFGLERTVRILAGLKGLKSGFAELAFQLIAERCGPPPWDMRAAPENQRFLQKLRAAGVCTAPWLDGIGSRNVEIGGVTLALDLERDPLEVFRMGEPFQTCLSPGDFCFYSTIANAADINKRVLYARDHNGTIQGRCLLALTDQGHILTFHVYAHDHREAMEQAVGAFVLELSEAMGATIGSAGRVSTLVASNWLDDGPHDLLGAMQWLEPGSQFCKSLQKIDPQDLAEALNVELQGKPITAAIVCELSADPAFEERPQLIVPLLPHLKDIATMDPWSSLRVLPVVRAAGKDAAALDLLERIHPLLLHDDFSYSYVPVMAAREWAALEKPHHALRLLRQTRPSNVRDWEGEWTERTVVAAIAMAQLHRPRQALSLCRIVRRDGSRELLELEKELEVWLKSDEAAQA